MIFRGHSRRSATPLRSLNSEPGQILCLARAADYDQPSLWESRNRENGAGRASQHLVCKAGMQVASHQRLGMGSEDDNACLLSFRAVNDLL